MEYRDRHKQSLRHQAVLSLQSFSHFQTSSANNEKADIVEYFTTFNNCKVEVQIGGKQES